MGPVVRATGRSLGWLGRHSRGLHRVAWLMLLAMLLKTCSDFGHGSGDWTFRYPPENFVVLAVLLLLAAASVGSLVLLATKRRMAVLPGLILSGLFLSALLPPRSPFRDGALSRVCGERVGCFFLTTAPVLTDTVYDLWHAPERDSWIWQRSAASRALSYSEDGSAVFEPRLLLSGGERYLVVARGGYLVDAIEMASGRNLVGSVPWDAPDRDRRMQRKSDAVQRLLDGDA